MRSEYTIRDDKANTVGMTPPDLMWGFCKGLPNGEYSVIGPRTDCTILVRDGIIYPTSGVMLGGRIDPRTNAEAIEYFGVPQ